MNVTVQWIQKRLKTDVWQGLHWFGYKFNEEEMDLPDLDFEGLVLNLGKRGLLSPEDERWIKMWYEYTVKSSKWNRKPRWKHYIEYHPGLEIR
jgi:hypothetical protein